MPMREQPDPVAGDDGRPRHAQRIEMVGLKRDAADKFPSELSGGMNQARGARPARCRSIPTSSSSTSRRRVSNPIGAADFDELIATLRDTLGLTVYMVTHDLDSLFTVCDRIAALADQRVIAQGPIETMLASEHPWVRSYFHGKRARAVATESASRTTYGNPRQLRPHRIVHAPRRRGGVPVRLLVRGERHGARAGAAAPSLPRLGIGSLPGGAGQLQRHPGRRGSRSRRISRENPSNVRRPRGRRPLPRRCVRTRRRRLEFSGLTGIASVSLSGGDPDAPPLIEPDMTDLPTIVAEPSDFQDLIESARKHRAARLRASFDRFRRARRRERPGDRQHRAERRALLASAGGPTPPTSTASWSRSARRPSASPRSRIRSNELSRNVQRPSSPRSTRESVARSVENVESFTRTLADSQPQSSRRPSTTPQTARLASQRGRPAALRGDRSGRRPRLRRRPQSDARCVSIGRGVRDTQTKTVARTSRRLSSRTARRSNPRASGSTATLTENLGPSPPSGSTPNARQTSRASPRRWRPIARTSTRCSPRRRKLTSRPLNTEIRDSAGGNARTRIGTHSSRRLATPRGVRVVDARQRWRPFSQDACGIPGGASRRFISNARTADGGRRSMGTGLAARRARVGRRVRPPSCAGPVGPRPDGVVRDAHHENARAFSQTLPPTRVMDLLATL